MKRGKVLMTVLVVLAVLFASCSNGMSKDDASGAASGEKVMVSLGVDVEGGVSQKTISTDTDLDGLTYWYKANHNWNQDRPVHGDTGVNFVMIPNYSTGAAPKNLGYFTAGDWLFSVQVKKGNAVIYSATDVPYNIYTDHASPVITVTPDGVGKGTISITVKVPTTGPQPAHQPAQAGDGVYHERLEVLAEGVAGGVTMTRVGTSGGLTTFTGEKGNLAPGAYTFRLIYHDETDAVTEGAAQAVTLFAGQTSYISGTIDGGKWHSSSITINAPGIATYSLTADGGATSVAPSTELEYTCTATSAQNNDITYEWFVNGSSLQGPSADNTFPFTRPSCGMYIVTCSAIDATAGVTHSESLYVEVGYKVTFSAGTKGTVGYGTGVNASTIFAGGDIVSMSVTPNSGYTVNTLTPAGQYDDASHTATFYMPSANTNFVATFAQVVISASEHGSVAMTDDPSTIYSVGDSVSLTVTPDANYHLASLKANGVSIMSSYDSGAGTASVELPANGAIITATFEANPAP